jgi:hypothetical protein
MTWDDLDHIMASAAAFVAVVAAIGGGAVALLRRLRRRSVPDDKRGLKEMERLEQDICLKADAEFRLAERKFNELPVQDDKLTKIAEFIKSNRDPKVVLAESINIRREVYIVPL